MVIDAQALGDDRHPRIEAPLPGESRHRPQRLEERLLRQLLGHMLVVDSALAVEMQAGVVAAVQLVEGSLVTPLVAQDEHAIAIQVDNARVFDLLGSKRQLEPPPTPGSPRLAEPERAYS